MAVAAAVVVDHALPLILQAGVAGVEARPNHVGLFGDNQLISTTNCS